MTAATSGFRADIQGMRALAVMAVLVFHIWPKALPGGYVGVDVFFVISGYLITGLLLRDAEANGRVSIIEFYSRRIRRLLPAATLVLVAIAACVPILPLVRWEGTADEIMASALYVENWWLAAKAVDYLGSEEAPSALQHYWSLSIEEQYYVLWPLLLGLLAITARRLHERPRLAFGVIICVVGVASLAYSIWFTPRNGAAAYFASTTRAWELALGSALAVFTRPSRLGAFGRDAMVACGIALIIVATRVYSSATPFPGYHALLPTIGTAMVIHGGGVARRWSPAGLLAMLPARYLGDISYSLYLWHWPIIVFYRELSGREPGLVDGLVIMLVSVALAHQTKDLVEDRFRFGRVRTGFVFAGGAVSIGLALASAAVVSRQYERITAELRATATQSAEASPAALRPAPTRARSDQPAVNKTKCHVESGQDSAVGCELGATKTGPVEIVLVGDSHAAQWTTALAKIARANGWRALSFTKSACAFAYAEIMHLGTRARYDSCIAWNANALNEIARLRPKIVLVTQSRRHEIVGAEKSQNAALMAAGLRRRWLQLQRTGAAVIAIGDTPWMRVDVADCMSGPRASIESCSTSFEEATSRYADPVAMAAKDTPAVGFIDMSDILCPNGVCIAAKDGVLRWRDRHHMTATYVASLAEEFESRLERAREQVAEDPDAMVPDAEGERQ